MAEENTFVLGGTRSGKSVFAENLVLRSGLKPIYIATGRAYDDEMRERIEIHKERRGDQWQTEEEPLALVDALRHVSFDGNIVLVDCLTLWITNLMMAEADVVLEAKGLAQFLESSNVPVVLVSTEVGQGIVPDNKMAREFVDLSGKVHLLIAEACDSVHFVTAGISQQLK